MDGRYLKLYMNGELDGSSGTSNANTGSFVESGSLDLDIVGGLNIGQTESHTVLYGSEEDQLAALGASLTSDTAAIGYMDGEMDEVAVWDRALDGNTIKSLYNNGVPKWDLTNGSGLDGYQFYQPYVDNLIAWWRFEEGSGTTVKDSSPSGNDLEVKGEQNSETWSTNTPE